MSEFMKVWDIKEQDFPHNGSAAEKLAFCLRYAILAPSTYNTQPWHFVVNDNEVQVYADRRYGLPVIDPEDRMLLIACGSAIYLLRLAIQYFGYKETTEILPDPDRPDLLARIKMGEQAAVLKDEEKELFGKIAETHINDRNFQDKDVSDESLNLLKAAAVEHQTVLQVCNQREKNNVLRMVIEADHVQCGDKHFRRELASWSDPLRDLNGEGLAHINMSYQDVVGSFKPSIARRYEGEKNQVVSDEAMLSGSPVLAVLGSRSGGEVERLNVGHAFMHILLAAQSEGLSVSTLNQVCEVPDLRLRLHDELEHQGRAQLIMCIGYSQKPTFTPRRTLPYVMNITDRKQASLNGASPENAEKQSFWEKIRAVFVAKP